MERLWWRRAVAVLRRPREVFATFRIDSQESALARQDVVVALCFVAGIALALGLGGGSLDDLDALDAFVWIFVTGLSLGFAWYWLVGSSLAFVTRRLGGQGSPRRVRHILAFSWPPLVFALPLWLIFPPLLTLLGVWSLALLLLGLREVYRWSLGRAAGAVVLALVWLAALAVAVWSALALLGGLG
ncbi:MAG TPA: YIP1 family protein [Gaiellaceae bacterium]|nr:YIP1 family protein [Gaiellaceae bacterium]